MVLACATPAETASCVSIDDETNLLPFEARYVDRLGVIWQLSDVSIVFGCEYLPPLGKVVTGSFVATATSPQEDTLLLHGDFRVCYVCAVGLPI